MDNEKVDEEKYFCHECESMMYSEAYNQTNREGAYIKRNGHLPVCKKCNKNLGIRKKAKKDGVEKTKAEITRYENVIYQKRIALNAMIEKEGGGIENI